MLRAERLCEPIDDQAHVRADRVCNEDGLLAASGSQSLCHAGDGVGPAELLPLTLAALARPYQRRADAVGVIQPLQSRLGDGVVLAAIDRIVDVALDLLRAALHDPHDDAERCAVLPVYRRVPVVEARDHVLGHLDRRLNEQFFLRNAARGGRHRGGRTAHQRQELSSS